MDTLFLRTREPVDSSDPIPSIGTLLENLPPGSHGSSALQIALKGALRDIRFTAAELNRIEGGRASGALMSGFCDRLLTLLLSHALASAGLDPQSPVALVALGSYGRQELAPFSDIDLMILCGESVAGTQLDVLVGAILHPLWDSGIQVGHSVRCPQECLQTMEDTDDGTLETATSVLESRFIAGNRPFSDDFCTRAMPAFFQKHGRAFVEAKFEETIRRWQGQSVYRTQPNLKESPGALRDYQLAVWIDSASNLSGHLPRLKDHPLVSAAAIAEARAGYEKMLTMRASLHSICKRKQDVLDFHTQQAVADDLGYESIEEFQASDLLLKDYYRSATAVHRLAQTVTRRYLEERAVASRDIERLRRRKIDADFTRVGNYLYASRGDLFSGPDWLAAALHAYVHAARHSIMVGTDIVAAIRARLPEIDHALRRSPGPRKHFETLMRMRENVGNTLRAMRDAGLLGAYIPEFGEIEGMVISDAYHDFTVDEHTLLVVRAADDLYKSVDDADAFRRGVLEALPRPYLLRLACLFHDFGKSRGAAGHSERGADMIPQLAERLGLSDSSQRMLYFLVQEHLTLSKTSQRRDTRDAALLGALAAKIETKERLDLLLLLTYCDSRSVGQGAFPMWKDALLTELYKELLQRLQPGAKSDSYLAMTDPVAKALAEDSRAFVPEEKVLLEERLKHWASTDTDRELVTDHCRLVPRRYLIEVSFEDAVTHIQAIRRMRENKSGCETVVRGSGALVDLWVVSEDRPRRFSQICGAFLGEGVSIISAIAYTRGDGVIIDLFRVAPALDSAEVSEAFWKKIAASIEAALAGQPDFLAKIEAARKRIPRTPPIARSIEPVVRVDNKLSQEYSVVDVKCADRIGLLYSLSRALSDLGCDIHFAKIATNQGLVTDVFYITESGGAQVTDAEKLLNIRRLLKAVAADYMEAKR